MLERLTTQTPGTAYLPSAAFRSMTLALFWDRSTLGFLLAGSAIFGCSGVERCSIAGLLVDNGSYKEGMKCQLG